MRQLKKVNTMLGIEVTPSDMNDFAKGKLWQKIKAKRITPAIAEAEFKSNLEYGSWARDPDGDASMELLEKRARGDFEYAMNVMAKIKTPDVAGNVQNLNELELESGLLVGEEIDFDAYERGDCRCLGRWNVNKTESGQRVLKIAVGIGANYSVSAEKIVEMAAPAFALAKSYADAGYGVEMIAFNAVQSSANDGKSECVVAVNCGEAVVSQAVSMLASSAMFRSVVFRMQDCVEGWTHCPCYGYPINHSQNARSMKEVDAFLFQNYGDDTIVIHSGATIEDVKRAVAMGTKRTTSMTFNR